MKLRFVIWLFLFSIPAGAQQYNPSDFRDFARSPTEHQLVVIDKPFVVRSAQGVLRFREHPGEPLVDVLFELQGSDKKIRRATSDKNGRFKVRHVPDGTYKFKTTRDGFTSTAGWVNISRTANKDAQIEIEIGIGN